jgi:hypothetical protein
VGSAFDAACHDRSGIAMAEFPWSFEVCTHNLGL